MKRLELKSEDALFQDGNALGKEERIREILELVDFEKGDSIIYNERCCTTEEEFLKFCKNRI